MPPGEIRFWFEPSADRVVLFFVALIGLFVAVRLLKTLYRKSIQNRFEKKLREKLDRLGLSDRPEEKVIREMIERYHVRPPDALIGSLQQFDSIASDEIVRIEKERMDLAERLDRIEYLYSIRMTAFAKEPSVGGLATLIGPSDVPIQATPASAEPPPEPESEVHADASDAENDLEEDTTLSEEEMTDLKTLLTLRDDSEEGEEREGSDESSR